MVSEYCYIDGRGQFTAGPDLIQVMRDKHMDVRLLFVYQRTKSTGSLGNTYVDVTLRNLIAFI